MLTNTRDILRGCVVGNMQHVGVFTMIPLLLDKGLQCEDFVSSTNAEVTNSAYGNLTFINVTDKSIIIPAHASYMTKESAQDHAMMRMGYVTKGKTKQYNDCACIQQTQGGHLSRGKKSLAILPWALRADATALKGKESYSKLWPYITRFNNESGISRSEGHLIYFYEKFQKELDEFVVQFEPVKGQVGAIILINGVVFGIERCPNEEFFREVFDALIRTCYGTAAIRLSKDIDVKKTVDYKTYVHIDANVSTIDEVLANYDKAKAEEMLLARKIVSELIDDPLITETDETVDSVQVVSLRNEQLIGQCMLLNNNPVYASVVVRKEWLLTNRKWVKAKAFEI